MARPETIVVVRRNSRFVFKSAHLIADGSCASLIRRIFFFLNTKFLLFKPDESFLLTCLRLSAIFSRTTRLCRSFSNVMNTLVTSYDFFVKYRIFSNHTHQCKVSSETDSQRHSPYNEAAYARSYLRVKLLDTF